ncbi:HAD-IA family hydrolase [Streptomyces sp. NPDC053431]|uniref:HAD-IA family hydrolase n=1 Tax=Streptomyces sp. NPDC053431 TaxID=3365703 RepID=UPI0037D65A1B
MEALPEVLPEVASRFDVLLFSGRLMATKPASAASTRALELVDCSPGEAVFIDDKPNNIAGARAVGITALHFTGAEDLSTARDELLER